MIRITIYNEYIHEQEYDDIRKVYPNGIHGCLKEFFDTVEGFETNVATFDMTEHGLSEQVLQNTDVLIFWSHARQDEFSEAVADRVCEHIRRGMGFIGLHSAHYSKIMKKILGTSMTLKWRHGDREKLWCINRSHPIAYKVPEMIELPEEEMYGEYFDIPKPDDIVFMGWFAGGEVFRSGCTFTRGFGKIFYFQPGHEEYPIYYRDEIRQILENAVRFCNPQMRRSESLECEHVE